MPDLGKYAIEVYAAYGVSLFLLGGIVALSVHRDKASKRALKEVERG